MGWRYHVLLFEGGANIGDADILIEHGGESDLFGIHGFLLTELMICVGEKFLKNIPSFISNVFFLFFYFISV